MPKLKPMERWRRWRAYRKDSDSVRSKLKLVERAINAQKNQMRKISSLLYNVKTEHGIDPPQMDSFDQDIKAARFASETKPMIQKIQELKVEEAKLKQELAGIRTKHYGFAT
jgi:uncharacterized protein YhaN